MDSARNYWVQIAWVVLFLLFAVNAASAGAPSPGDLKKLRLAHIDPPIKAPEFRLMDLNGRRLALHEFRGKGVLLYFWASW